MGCGPLRPPPHDDDRHTDGWGCLGGTGLDLKPRHVLLFLPFQRAGLCLWRPTAQPGTADPLVRSIARKSHGVCLPRDRHRGSNGPLDVPHARPAFRMADRFEDFGLFDRGRLVSPGSPGERAAKSKNNRWIDQVREPEDSIQGNVVLSTHPREHVLDCRSQWHSAESEASPESRSPLRAEGCRGCPVAGAGLQYRWPVTDGLATHSLFQEARHATDVPTRCRGHPSAVPRDYPANPLGFRCDFWYRSWWRLHDHSVNDSGNFWD